MSNRFKPKGDTINFLIHPSRLSKNSIEDTLNTFDHTYGYRKIDTDLNFIKDLSTILNTSFMLNILVNIWGDIK